MDSSPPYAHVGRILAAYGGIFIAGSLACGVAVDGYRPDRYDVIGALICLAGVAVIMYSPRPQVSQPFAAGPTQSRRTWSRGRADPTASGWLACSSR
jgi:hypothetical protein